MVKRRAISIRQPWAELLLLGEKRIEYRSVPCRKLGERVYIYAAPKVEEKERKEFRRMGVEPGALPVGVLVGTIEFTKCTGSREKGYRWWIVKPKRLERRITPRNKPQPVWFIP